MESFQYYVTVSPKNDSVNLEQAILDVQQCLKRAGYKTEGQYNEALPLYERSLAIFTAVLGAAHPSTKVVTKNLAALKSSLRPAL